MTQFGAYGKIPGLGDFLRIGVGSDFVMAWDRWLQQMLQEARMGLGHAWEGCYMSAPIWRFTLTPGLAGRYPVFGVMMPSVDRVGRQFPLTLMARGDGAAEATYQDLEEIALSALEDDMTPAALQVALNNLVWEASAKTAIDGTTWAALMGQSLLRMSCVGLPRGSDALRLFDMTRWNLPEEGAA